MKFVKIKKHVQLRLIKLNNKKMQLNKQVKKKFTKKNFYLMTIFLILNFCALGITYNKKNYIYNTSIDFGFLKQFNKTSILDYSEINISGNYYELMEYLNRFDFVNPKFKPVYKDKTLSDEIALLTNNIINLQYFKKNHLIIFQTKTNQNIQSIVDQLNKALMSFSKISYIKIIENNLEYFEGFGDDLQYIRAQIILDNIILNRINNIQEFNIEKKIKNTFSKHIFGIFNSIFIIILYFSYFRKK